MRLFSVHRFVIVGPHVNDVDCGFDARYIGVDIGFNSIYL